MSANAGNVDVVLNDTDLDIPSCPHGPALLFTKYDQKSKTQRRFFACSAFRDRKACPFFKWVDGKSSKLTANMDVSVNPCHLWPTLNHRKMRKRYLQYRKLKKSERRLCADCGLLLLPNESDVHEGQGHTVRSSITKAMLREPTCLFTPLQDNKTFAQYLFSEPTVNFILETLLSLDVTHVLCVGCPRIHEKLMQQSKTDKGRPFSSLLMDLDHRYLQVYPPSQFCHYNMLNHHFFGGEPDSKTFCDFIRDQDRKKVALVIDPPFGIMVDALSSTLKKLQKTWREANGLHEAEEMPVLWFFPYFMEQRVLDANEGYTMLDYKVDYDNHVLFRGENGRKKGSPVRIFTNLHPKDIQLEKPYWYCDKCERFSAPENQHCELCGTCPTKDGPTYRHCHECNRCVKPSRVHCRDCNMCDLPQHTCETRKNGCHICGELDHKRRDCPNKGDISGKRKKLQSSYSKMNKRKK